MCSDVSSALIHTHTHTISPACSHMTQNGTIWEYFWAADKDSVSCEARYCGNIPNLYKHIKYTQSETMAKIPLLCIIIIIIKEGKTHLMIV